MKVKINIYAISYELIDCNDMPCFQDDTLNINIDMDQMLITNWKRGRTGGIHIKTADEAVKVYHNSRPYSMDVLESDGSFYMIVDEDGFITNGTLLPLME